MDLQCNKWYQNCFWARNVQLFHFACRFAVQYWSTWRISSYCQVSLNMDHSSWLFFGDMFSYVNAELAQKLPQKLPQKTFQTPAGSFFSEGAGCFSWHGIWLQRSCALQTWSGDVATPLLTPLWHWRMVCLWPMEGEFQRWGAEMVTRSDVCVVCCFMWPLACSPCSLWGEASQRHKKPLGSLSWCYSGEWWHTLAGSQVIISMDSFDDGVFLNLVSCKDEDFPVTGDQTHPKNRTWRVIPWEGCRAIISWDAWHVEVSSWVGATYIVASWLLHVWWWVEIIGICITSH